MVNKWSESSYRSQHVTYDLSPCFIYPVLQLLTQNEIRKKEKELEDNLRHLKILETVSMQQVWWEMAVCDFAVPVAVPNLHPVFRCSTKCRNLCSNVMSALLKHSDIIICAPMPYIDF